MKFSIALLLMPALAAAQVAIDSTTVTPLPPARTGAELTAPTNAKLQPFYPSPYADAGWLTGDDCVWEFGGVALGYWVGTCHYHGDVAGQEGWAEVHWAPDFTPLLAIPCDLAPSNDRTASYVATKRGSPCPMPVRHRAKKVAAAVATTN